jgi:hypothetical protein
MVRLDSLTFSGGPFGSPFFLIAAKMSALGQERTSLNKRLPAHSDNPTRSQAANIDP